MEIDLHGGGIDARGATFPGISLYVLIGRGKDFAWSTTTAYSDNVDEFVEKLCQDDRHYVYKGQCIPFEAREHTMTVTPAPTDPAGTPPRTIRMELLRSVHGPIQAFATVGGQPVAISEARSTYQHEIDSVVAYKRLNSGEVTSPKTFQQAFGRETSPSTTSTPTRATSPTSPPAGTRGGPRAPTRACPRGAPASGTGAGASPTGSCRSRSTRRAATSRIGTTSRRRAGGRPTTGRSAPSSACSDCRSACARGSRAGGR